MNKKILIVDDEPSIREFFQILFSRMSDENQAFEVTVAESGEKAFRLLKQKSFDMVISDMKMSGMSGLQLLEKTKALYSNTVFILITAFDTTQTAVQAMKMGAYDYISKPFNVEKIKHVVFSALELKEQSKKNEHNTEEMDGFLVGRSLSLQKIFKDIQHLAFSSSNILITGESGTGKEMVARLAHNQSALKDQPFVAVNCGAIPDTLIESEMFGHKKGSFTGAVTDKKGFFDLAEGGTLFLDEIGELPLMVQPKLLRALQEKTIRPVGAVKDRKVKVRLITATNRELEKMVALNQFREDLFYRLNVIRINIPPLRERREDISFFVQHFLQKHKKKLKLSIKTISEKAISLLEKYHWPGNVRELENLMERVMILSEGDRIEDSDILSALKEKTLKPSIAPTELNVSLPDEGLDLTALMDGLEKSLLQKALKKTDGAKTSAAHLLKLSLRSFRYRLQKHHLLDEEWANNI